MTKKNDFKFIMPLIKSYDGDHGYYHIEFGLSTTQKDLQDDTMTPNALEGMVEQIKHLELTINDGHQHKLKDTIGPMTDAHIEDGNLIADLRVRKMWEEEIRDLVDSGTPLGGSIEGNSLKTIHKTIQKLEKDIIDEVQLYGGALTPIPAAWNLRGTAREKKKARRCIGSVCSQIQKSITMDTIKDGSLKIRDSVISKASGAISRGAVDTGEWNGTNLSIEDLKKWAAVIDTTKDPNTKTAYKYPLGKGDNASAKGISSAQGYARNSLPALASKLEPLTEKLSNKKDKTLTKTIKCPSCGQFVQNGHIFCPQCGGKVKSMIRCPNCSNNVDELHNTFCPNCGAKLNKKIGDGELTKNETPEIPNENEGMDDDNIIEKIKDLLHKARPTKNKPVEDSPEEEAAETADEEDEEEEEDKMKKKTVSTDLEKVLLQKDTEIKALQKRLDTRDEADLLKEKDTLLKESLKLQKRLNKDMTPEEESNLVKEIKTDLEKTNGVQLVERDITVYKKALTKIPTGPLPPIDKTLENQKTEYEKKLEKLNKKINEHGIVKDIEESD